MKHWKQESNINSNKTWISGYSQVFLIINIHWNTYLFPLPQNGPASYDKNFFLTTIFNTSSWCCWSDFLFGCSISVKIGPKKRHSTTNLLSSSIGISSALILTQVEPYSELFKQANRSRKTPGFIVGFEEKIMQIFTSENYQRFRVHQRKSEHPSNPPQNRPSIQAIDRKTTHHATQ